MKLIELMQKHPFPEYQLLKEKYPSTYAFASKVEVIPWREEFAVADKNPEELEVIERLEALLREGKITPEEYEFHRKKLSNYVSKTLGVAFIEAKKVAFREAVPKPAIVIHELGHVYFEVNDLLWNASYGGGEVLLWLGLNGKYDVKEEDVRRYHELLKQIFEDHDSVHRYVAKVIAPKINVYPHLFTISLYAGYVPKFNARLAFEFWDDLESPRWSEIPVTQEHVFSFFQNLVSGLAYDDPFCVAYAEWLGIVKRSPSPKKKKEKKKLNYEAPQL